MGRRKKEPRSAHREHIASAAQILFMERGTEYTTMDDIAKTAGYSKATLYVYFENKEEIVNVLVLESMKKLHACLAQALEKGTAVRETYFLMCQALLQYQEEFPFYFKTALQKIHINFEQETGLLEENETYRAGEEINRTIEAFLVKGMDRGEFRSDLVILPTIFSFWGMLSGLIQTASSKESYITRSMGMAKGEFLEYGFRMLYNSIADTGKNEREI